MSNGWQNILVIFCLHAFIVVFFPHSTNTFSDRFDEVRPLSKRFKHVQKLKRGTTCVFMHFVWIGLLSLISLIFALISVDIH